ncbi:MAG: ABC transporter ATP-binding protein [Hyphomicrobiaceae bacterium]
MADFLQVTNLSRSFGGLKAVRDVSFTLAQGEILGVIGPNGAGKSTLFDMLAGVTVPDAGSILFEGVPVTGRPLDAMARAGIVKTFQTSRPFTSMTFLENVMTAAFARTLDKTVARRTAEEALGFVGLVDRAEVPASGASTGQRKRLELARVLATRPKLLLLDEPFGGVDMAAIETLIGLLLRIRESGVTILFVEHNLDAVHRLADRVFAMTLGSKIAEGTAAEVVADPRVVRAYLGDEAADAA